jgi:hypothetical protein
LGNKSKKWIRQAFNARARLVDLKVLHKKDLELDLQIVVVPCEHFCDCAMCAAGREHCPMCRHDVLDIACIIVLGY